jgi:rsbT co-antagonist protein RsbR
MSTIPINNRTSALSEILSHGQAELLAGWLSEMSGSTRRSDLMKDAELRAQCAQFLSLVKQALDAGSANFNSSAWDAVREMLSSVSRTRAEQGFTPTETATFIFSAKRPIFSQLRQICKNDAEALATEIWTATQLLDSMGLYTTEIYQKSRESLIKRQQEELLELSTPVVKLWEGVLALPIIGTLDSARTQVVMESLLQAIVQSNSRVAIIDITGVPTVDTVVAQHLLKTITAARLMGADCIISGVRPQIAQTIVHLGINLQDVTTKATLAAAFKVALERIGLSLGRDGMTKIEPRKS